MEDIFIAQLSTTGTLYVDTFEDKKPITSNVSRDLLLGRLKRLETRLESHAQETDSKKLKRLFLDMSERARKIHRKLSDIWSDRRDLKAEESS